MSRNGIAVFAIVPRVAGVRYGHPSDGLAAGRPDPRGRTVERACHRTDLHDLEVTSRVAVLTSPTLTSGVGLVGYPAFPLEGSFSDAG